MPKPDSEFFKIDEVVEIFLLLYAKVYKAIEDDNEEELEKAKEFIKLIEEHDKDIAEKIRLAFKTRKQILEEEKDKIKANELLLAVISTSLTKWILKHFKQQ